MAQRRLARADGVDLEARFGPQPVVHVGADEGIGRMRALLGKIDQRLGQEVQRFLHRRRQRLRAGAQRRRQAAVRPAPRRREDGHQRLDGVERGAAELPRMQVALAGAHMQVISERAARRDVEGRAAARDHRPVEDQAAVGPRLHLPHAVERQRAGPLLRAIDQEADVDGERAMGEHSADRLEIHDEMALVVDDAAAVEPLAADFGAERRALPQGEVAGRLHVEMPVDEQRRGRFGADLSRQVGEQHLLAGRADDAGGGSERGKARLQPCQRRLHVGGMRRVDADARYRHQLLQLRQPAAVARASVHGVPLCRNSDVRQPLRAGDHLRAIAPSHHVVVVGAVQHPG